MFLGTIVNVITIIVGTTLGLFFTKIKDQYKETIMQGIGLTTIIIGVQMALNAKSIIIILLSILFGAIIGELLKLDYWLNDIAEKVNERFKKVNKNANIAEGFVTASLIFVVGAMTILGALDSGIRGDHGILFTKSILDGFTSLVLATTLGFGVIFSAVPVFVIQGSITLIAKQIELLVPEVLLHQVINEVTVVGGILILAIGLNLLKITKIRVINLIPALFVVVILVYGLQFIS